MKAIITREYVTGMYYRLPVFESNPIYYINWPDITWSNLITDGFSKKSNSSKKYEYYLILVPNGNGILNQLRAYGSLNFTDEEIRLINENYFYLLDHPDIKECEVNLV